MLADARGDDATCPVCDPRLWLPCPGPCGEAAEDVEVVVDMEMGGRWAAWLLEPSRREGSRGGYRELLLPAERVGVRAREERGAELPVAGVPPPSLADLACWRGPAEGVGRGPVPGPTW